MLAFDLDGGESGRQRTARQAARPPRGVPEWRKQQQKKVEVTGIVVR